MTPPSLLLVREGIKDGLRSSVAGFLHPPTGLTGVDSWCARPDPRANRGDRHGDAADLGSTLPGETEY